MGNRCCIRSFRKDHRSFFRWYMITCVIYIIGHCSVGTGHGVCIPLRRCLICPYRDKAHGTPKAVQQARQGCVGSYGDGFRHYKNRKSRTEEFLYGFFIALVLIFLRTSYYTLKPLLRRLSISSPSISALVDETE